MTKTELIKIIIDKIRSLDTATSSTYHNTSAIGMALLIKELRELNGVIDLEPKE